MALFLKATVLLLSACLAMAMSPLPGGFQNADIHSKEVMNALDAAVNFYNKQDGKVFLSKVENVLKAQQQVVAGINYIFTVKMVYTKCKKNAVKKLCAVNPNPKWSKPFICNFEVWSQPWLNSLSVTKSSCNK